MPTAVLNLEDYEIHYEYSYARINSAIQNYNSCLSKLGLAFKITSIFKDKIKEQQIKLKQIVYFRTIGV